MRGTEVWEIKEKNKKKLLATETDVWRRCREMRLNKVSNKKE